MIVFFSLFAQRPGVAPWATRIDFHTSRWPWGLSGAGRVDEGQVWPGSPPSHRHLLAGSTPQALLGPPGFWADLRAGAQAGGSHRLGPAAEAPRRWGVTVYPVPSSGCAAVGADLEGPLIPVFRGFWILRVASAVEKSQGFLMPE